MLVDGICRSLAKRAEKKFFDIIMSGSTTDWARCVYLERVRKDLQVHHDILNEHFCRQPDMR